MASIVILMLAIVVYGLTVKLAELRGQLEGCKNSMEMKHERRPLPQRDYDVRLVPHSLTGQ